MADHAGDFRPPSEWGHLRTACHGCRSVGYETGDDERGTTRMRPILIPGDGSITRMVASPSEPAELAVVMPCAVCGETDTPGWIPGLAPPA